MNKIRIPSDGQNLSKCVAPGTVTRSGAQTPWALSGKVVDAEEGNGLNAVEVSLVKAGLRTTTAKNGT